MSDSVPGIPGDYGIRKDAHLIGHRVITGQIMDVRAYRQIDNDAETLSVLGPAESKF